MTDTDLDLIWGAAAIAALIGKSRMATFHMLRRGQLPARRCGRRWCVTRKALRDFFEATGGTA